MEPNEKIPRSVLPTTLTRKVFQRMDPMKIIEAAKLSEDFADLVKRSGPLDHELAIDFRSGKILMRCRGILYEMFVQETIGDKIRVIKTDEFGPLRVYLHVDNSGDAWMDLGLWISNLFNCPIMCFHTGPRRLSAEKFQQHIDRIIRRQPVIEELSLYFDRYPADELQHILGNIRVNHDLFINITQVPQIEFEFLYSPRIIRIIHSAWFTMQNLQEINNAYLIKLENSHLTNGDLDVVMRQWTQGGYENLQYLEVTGSGLDLNTPILGITPPFEGSGYKMLFSLYQYSFVMVNGVEIRSVNGKDGLMKLEQTADGITFKMMNITESD